MSRHHGRTESPRPVRDWIRHGPGHGKQRKQKLNKPGSPVTHWNEPGLPERKRGVSRNRWYLGGTAFWRCGPYGKLTSHDRR